MKPQLWRWVAAIGAVLAVVVVIVLIVRASSSSDSPEAAADKPEKTKTEKSKRPRNVKLPDGAFMVKSNGGWCWFQDERVIVDGGNALVGTVAGTSRDGTTAGDIELTSFDIASKKGKTTKLHPKLQSDDHASPAVLRLADGRYLTAYAKHAKDKSMFFRVSEKPGDASAWKAETSLKLDGNVTYANLVLEPGDKGRVFNFYRGGDNLPHVMTAPAAGEPFTEGGPLFAWTRKSPSFDEKKSTRPTDPKPYIRFASRNGVTHFITTEDHPRTYDNSIYHGYIKGTALYDSAGNVLDDDILKGEPIELTKLTKVYEGNRDNVAWTVDLDVDADGKPFVAFVVQKDGQGRSSKKVLGGEDHRFHYARFDGKTWSEHEIAYAGRMLYKHEVNYTGLIALVPKNPDVMFMATNVDPVTGKKPEGEQHFELYRGATEDRGKTWKWSALTKDSKVENIRPVVPEWSGGTLVMWLRGDYTSMGKYDMDVVGMLDPQGGSAAPAGSGSAGAPSASAKAPAAPSAKAAPAPSAKAPAAAPSP